MPRSQGRPVPRYLVALLALAMGAGVANLYYAQPLLHTIGAALGVSDGTAGLLVTASQIGYAAGLVLLVPLGDLLERRALIVVLLTLSGTMSAAAAVAPSFAALAGALAVLGLTSAVVQIIVPMAASLAGDHERGQVVGTVMSGLLIGILAARTVSGALSALGGWRLVFGVAAGLMLVLAVVLLRVLPAARAAGTLRYGALLGSVVTLVRTEPVLRQRMVLGAAGMGCFTILWTAIAFLLSGSPYHYGPGLIGLFGLAGLAGAAAAPLAGRFADHGHARMVTTIALVAFLASWGLLALGGRSLALLLAGIVLLDLSQQTLQINHQSAIYALRPEARSRLTTAFTAPLFLGGTAASAATTVVYPAAGWTGAVILGAGIIAAALVFWLITERAVTCRDHNPTQLPASEPDLTNLELTRPRSSRDHSTCRLAPTRAPGQRR